MLTRRHAIGLVAGALIGLASATQAAERVPFDRAAFDAALAAGGPVLIDISADWCSTCQRQKAILTELTAKPEFADYLIFQVDYDTEKDVMRSFGAQHRSTLIAFSGGVEVGRVVGETQPAAIAALLGAGL